MALAAYPDAQFNDSFFFVSVNPKTAGEKAPTRNTGSRAHVMRFVRRRDQSGEKWRKRAIRLELASGIAKERTANHGRPLRWRRVSYFPGQEELSETASTSKSQAHIHRDRGAPSIKTRGDQDSHEHLALRMSARNKHSSDSKAIPNRHSGSSTPKQHPADKEAEGAMQIALKHADNGNHSYGNIFSYVGIQQSDRKWQSTLYSYKTFLVGAGYPLYDPDLATTEIFRVAAGDEMVMAAVSLLTVIGDRVRCTSLDVDLKRAPAEPGKPLYTLGESQKYKGATIRLLNQKLCESKAPYSDTILFAIYKIICAELFLGNFSEADIHRRGLARIVQLRGGLENVSLIFAQGVLMSETLIPSIPPRIERPKVFDQISVRTLQDICRQHGVEPPMNDIGSFPPLPEFCDPELLALIPRIRDLVLYGNEFGLQYPSDKKLQALSMVYQFKVVVVRHQVASYKAKSTVDVVFQDALIAFLMTNFVWVNPGGLPLRWVTASLAASLTSDVISCLQETAPEVLFWISMVGGFCSLEQIEAPKYLGLVRRTAAHLNVTTWDSCRQLLDNVMFFRASRLIPYFKKVLASALGSRAEELLATTVTALPLQETMLDAESVCNSTLPHYACKNS